MRHTWMIALLLGLAFTTPAYAEVDAVTGATQVGAGTDKQTRDDERVRKAMRKMCKSLPRVHDTLWPGAANGLPNWCRPRR